MQNTKNMKNMKKKIAEAIRYHMSAEGRLDEVRKSSEERIKNAYKSLERWPVRNKDEDPVRLDAVKHDVALSPEERVEKARRDSEKRITEAHKNLGERFQSGEYSAKR